MPTPDKDDAEKAKEWIIEIQSKLFDRASAYTNLILLGGYAGAFTIWNFVRGQLPPKATIAVASLLGVSLTFFIFFEVYKMIKVVLHFQRIAKAVSTASSPKDFVAKATALEVAAQRANVTSVRVWGFVLAITVATALMAIVLLFYNFFAILIGWRLWP